MAISDTLSSIATNLSNAYDALSAKGATIPAFKNIENLASAIATISAGADEEETIAKFIQRSTLSSFSDTNSALTSIPDYAFYGQSVLSSAYFPVATAIGKNAFEGCSNLRTLETASVIHSLGAGAFSNCLLFNPSTIVCDQGFIPQYAFYGVGRITLSDANFPGITEIGAYAFASMYGTSSCNISLNFSFEDISYQIQNYAFKKRNISALFMSGVYSIGDHAFLDAYGSGLSNITHSTFPDLYFIGSYAFASTINTAGTAIKTVDLSLVGQETTIEVEYEEDGETYTEEYYIQGGIGEGVFSGQAGLSFVSLPNIWEIPSNCFKGCKLLSSVNLENVEEIGNSAFQSCGFTEINDETFPNCYTFGNFAFASNSQLTNVTLLNNIGLGTNVFAGCKLLSFVHLEETEDIPKNAFNGCSNLASIEMPNVSFVDEYGFATTKIPFIDETNFPSLTTCKGYAFTQCPSLSYISLTHPTVSLSGFEACSQLKTIYLASCSQINGVRGCSNLSYVRIDNLDLLQQYAFSNCSKLSVVDFTRMTSVPRLFATGFYNTPINKSTYLGYFGSIYVPSSLYSDFLNQTTWGTYFSQRITSASVPI